VIDLSHTAGQTYAVMGLGASGIAAALALDHAGARVLAWDDDAARRDTAVRQGVALTDLGAHGLKDARALVLSPGIPHTFPRPHPLADTARASGVPVICDVELLLAANGPARVIGITGANGKSTVTALIGHVLNTAGRQCAIGGNLGPAALSLAPQDADGAFVLELSSYQIERMETAGIDIAVLINISPDHLDRHGGMDGYIAAKEHLFGLMRGAHATAVIGQDDPHCRAVTERVAARRTLTVVPVSVEAPVAGGVYVDNGRLIDATGEAPHEVADISAIATLPGRHNWQNAAAACAALLAFGLDATTIADGLASYPGLAHRQERIREIGRVLYVNDSKATNPEAALKALDCYDNIYWIAGGLAKDGGFAALVPALARIRHAYLIGAATDAIAATLEGRVELSRDATLEAALAAAHRDAQTSGGKAVVLLSPACASFDQFANFEARGDAFRALVQALPVLAAGRAAS
jgi:UDP-N-acetylmuramoylalanine--D-glutamate ligase